MNFVFSKTLFCYKTDRGSFSFEILQIRTTLRSFADFSHVRFKVTLRKEISPLRTWSAIFLFIRDFVVAFKWEIRRNWIEYTGCTMTRFHYTSCVHMPRCVNLYIQCVRNQNVCLICTYSYYELFWLKKERERGRMSANGC